MKLETTHHSALTSKQRTILNLLYRFRFATSEQLSQALNITKATTNKRLKLLIELGYIDRTYSRISHEHAIYYLQLDGITELKKISKQKYLPKVLRNIRNDGVASNQFVGHCLGVFDIYGTLRSQYGSGLQFFTKTQMTAMSYFPKKLPDVHIQLGTDNSKLFLLELLHDSQPFFLATRAVIRYIEYADSSMWPSQYDFPTMLLVCDTQALQKRLLKKMRHRMDTLDNPSVRLFITTLEQMQADEWRDMAGSDELLALSQI